MALLNEMVWRFLHALLYVQRALLAWFRVHIWRWKRAVLGLLLPLALGFHNPKKTGPIGKRTSRRVRWGADGRTLEKLPLHVGLLITEEEIHFTDIANLVVWCMAVGISYVSVYDNQGKTNLDSYLINSKHLQRFPERQSLTCDTKDWSNDDENSFLFDSVFCAAHKGLAKNHEMQPKQYFINIQLINSFFYYYLSPPPIIFLLEYSFSLHFSLLSTCSSLPSHVDVSYDDLFGALQRYAMCDQRLGK
uniref:ditrans,polycis-polyprenyl diphosphate synthase [(2E,6E)-farnesyldiphosphate specific] n=1 Tax=Sinocyclocheilus rhinocerous TaxID=307959 RepID=A0A673J0A3_9TELE